MPAPAVELLAAARRAGVVIDRDPAGRLVIDGPDGAGHLVAGLRRRGDVVAHVIDVWTGVASLLDWRHATVLDPPRPCRLCRQPAMLADPYDRQPCHKTCAETAITPPAADTHQPATAATTGPPGRPLAGCGHPTAAGRHDRCRRCGNLLADRMRDYGTCDGCDHTRPAPYCGHCPPTAGHHDQADLFRRAA
ncbi:hypothetical protein O7623_00850 [Solwaraspora sp. WMMD791]|uniref:hypothetical protein n=1 Tax=Solwaraspora sp. WMMD791 TaxID=3016086 RepID=UPI00249AB3E6|nr:hypothetical protein [Solwaraspora sp. WMMD791]WFE27794.1 hypothetical protein O7623_00850 [Solwaraspora sp. WMMD791]